MLECSRGAGLLDRQRLNRSPMFRSLHRGFCGVASPYGFVRVAFTPSFSSPAPLVLRAAVFDTPTGRAFLDSCPHTGVSLSAYGAEVYGPLRLALPQHRPQPRIPPGGLAFSEQGQFLCVFFGQDPAWPVDYIGQIEGDSWEALREEGTRGGSAGWSSLSVTADTSSE